MRTLGLGMCVIAILAVSALLDRDSGVGKWVELREDLSVLSARVARLARANDAMRREIEMLEAEPDAVDRAIREELDVALPGEIVVRFIPVSRGADETAEPDGGTFLLRDLLPGEPAGRETR